MRGAPDPRLLRARASHLLARLGPLGSAAAALVLAALAVFALHRLVLAPELARAQAEAAQRAALAARPAPVPPAPAPALVALLPPPASAPAFAMALQREAERQGVRIERTEYRRVADADAALVRWQIVLPAQGRYGALKRWLGSVLARHPASAIDELTFSAAPEAGAALQARVVLSLYLRAAP